MSIFQQRPIEVSSTKQRLCGNPKCRLPGHNIRHCNHSSVIKLKVDACRISKFSIGFNYPDFMRKWLKTLTKIQLVFLGAEKKSNSIIQMRQEVYDIFYNTPLSTLVNGIEDYPTVRRTFAREFTSIQYRNISQEMVDMGVPLRLTRLQQLNLNVTNARNSFQQSTNTLVIANRALETAQAAYVQAEQSRELTLSTYMNAEDEMEEYDRTHLNGVLIQRKFNFSTYTQPFENQTIQPNQEEELPEYDCPVCYDVLDDSKIQLNCKHYFCNTCITKYFDTLKRQVTPSCSMCRQHISSLTFYNTSCNYTFTNKYCSIIDNNNI